MKTKPKPPVRVIGLDSHPDTFTAAILTGSTPAEAVLQKLSDRVPLDQLQSWALKNTSSQDLFLLEASGNSFHIVRTLQSLDRKALVLESRHLGQLKESHANNDRISAERIAKAYLAGTAKTVWVPDPLTQERRDWFLSHQKAVKRTTQINNRLLSYLSDNGIRLGTGRRLPENKGLELQLRRFKDWTPRQWVVIETHLMELRQAQEQRQHWESILAREVVEDPLLLSLVRLCGVRDKVAFALGALIGDIHRFADPRKLVSYAGLNPRFDDSGESRWKGGVRGKGRKDLRALLIESAQAILRTTHPLARWGRKLMARKGSMKVAVVAVARRLLTAVWYLMMGQWTPLEEIDERLSAKLNKIIAHLGKDAHSKSGIARKDLKQQIQERLLNSRNYRLDPNLKYRPST